MIISERMPNLRDAKGVLDRSFSFTTYKGKPKYDIKETLEPQGNLARQERLDALNDFRKLMLIYRLIHFKDPIIDISMDKSLVLVNEILRKQTFKIITTTKTIRYLVSQ